MRPFRQEPRSPERSGEGVFRFRYWTIFGDLYAALHRIYELSVSLPDAPLREYEARVAGLPRTTEADRLVIQRIGQDIFRARLVDYWRGRCPLTGTTDLPLLRASHIIERSLLLAHATVDLLYSPGRCSKDR
jgi:hypothetical protein